jgi:hypothetical protein
MFDLRKRIMANQVAPAPEGSLSLPWLDLIKNGQIKIHFLIKIKIILLIKNLIIKKIRT